MKLSFTREDVAAIMKQIKDTKPETFLIYRRPNNTYTIAPYKGDDNYLYRGNSYTLYREVLGLRTPRRENLYQALTAEQYKLIEDVIYKEINSTLTLAKVFGFVPSNEMMTQFKVLLGHIKQYLQAKEQSKESYDIVEHTNITQEELPAIMEGYQAERQGEFVQALKVEGSRISNRNLSRLKDIRPLYRRFTEQYSGREIPDLTWELIQVILRTQKHFEDGIATLIKENSHAYSQEEIQTSLTYARYFIDQLSSVYQHLPRTMMQIQDFADKYRIKRIESYQTTLHNGRPYITVRGNDKFINKGAGTLPGVTRLDTGEYLMTFNAFNEFESYAYDEGEKDAVIDFLKGDWENLYYANKRYYLTPGKALAKAVEQDAEFTLYTYNSDKKYSNALGMVIPIFSTTFNGYGTGYQLDESQDDHYELLASLYEMVDKNTDYASRFEYYDRGYKIRQLEVNEESIERYEDDRKQLETLYQENADVLAEQFGKKTQLDIKRASDLKQFDSSGIFGLDVGFIDIEYENSTYNQELQHINKGRQDRVGPNYAHCYPRVQSLTIKRPFARYVVEEFNKRHPERKLKMTAKLD